MMKHEFEKIAGYEVTNEDYNNIIEPMYMAITALEFEAICKGLELVRDQISDDPIGCRAMNMLARIEDLREGAANNEG